MFMQIAIGAIGIGIVLMIGYLVVAQVKNALPTPSADYTNTCYGYNQSRTLAVCNTTAVTCGPYVDNTSLRVTCNSREYISGTNSVQVTVFAGFGLMAVGVIVLAAFGLIKIFE